MLCDNAWSFECSYGPVSSIASISVFFCKKCLCDYFKTPHESRRHCEYIMLCITNVPIIIVFVLKGIYGNIYEWLNSGLWKIVTCTFKEMIFKSFIFQNLF